MGHWLLSVGGPEVPSAGTDRGTAPLAHARDARLPRLVLAVPRGHHMERTLFDEIGGLDTSYLSAGDYQFLSEAMRREPFTRLPQALVAYRRRGDNLSIVSATGPSECRQVEREFGPRNAARRLAYKALLKAYVNARNPEWAYRKRRPLPVEAALEA